MASKESAIEERRPRQAPGVVVPTTRVNLALPFSKITVEEPGKDLVELAAIVADLAAAMEQAMQEPGLPEIPELPELRKRADALSARLRRLSPEVGQPMGGNLLKEAAPGPPATTGSGWTTGRIIALATGSVLLLISLVLIAGGGALTWADQEQLHSGYLTTSTATYSTSGYALASDPVDLRGTWGWLGRFTGQVRIRIFPVASADPSRPLFAGIMAAGDAERYLAGVSYTTVAAFGDRDTTEHAGTAVPATPSSALPWVAQAEGTGPLTLTWTVRDGDWMVVVMNPDASKGITVRADAGVSSPALPWLAGELLAAGVLLGVAAAALIIVPVRMATRPGQ